MNEWPKTQNLFTFLLFRSKLTRFPKYQWSFYLWFYFILVSPDSSPLLLLPGLQTVIIVLGTKLAQRFTVVGTAAR